MGHTPVGAKYVLDVERTSGYGSISEAGATAGCGDPWGHLWERGSGCISEIHPGRREPQAPQDGVPTQHGRPGGAGAAGAGLLLVGRVQPLLRRVVPAAAGTLLRQELHAPGALPLGQRASALHAHRRAQVQLRAARVQGRARAQPAHRRAPPARLPGLHHRQAEPAAGPPRGDRVPADPLAPGLPARVRLLLPPGPPAGQRLPARAHHQQDLQAVCGPRRRAPPALLLQGPRPRRPGRPARARGALPHRPRGQGGVSGEAAGGGGQPRRSLAGHSFIHPPTPPFAPFIRSSARVISQVKLVFVEDQAVVETVFFLTSRTRALLRRFPRILLVDRLPGLQGALDLLAVLCVDGAGRARQAACCVARPGTPSLLRFALASLLQSAPDVKGRVRCLTAGPEVAAQLPAVRQLLPGARVQICRAQGLETLFSKAQELGGAGREDPGLWPRLCRLAGASSPAAYAEALAELRAHGPAAFVDYFERNWAPRRDMWVRFRAFEAARDLDACALVRGHRRRLLRRLSPSRSVAQCLRDLVAMQWADAAGEAAPEGPDGGGPWPEGEPGRGAHVEKERMKGLESGDWAGTPREGSIWRGAQLEKEWARGVEARDRGGAQLESDSGRGLQVQDWRGPQSENEHWRGPEIRDWRGTPLEAEKDWGPEGYVGRGAWLEDGGPRALEGYTWRMAQLEGDSIRVLETTERRGAPFDPERAKSLEGSTWRGGQLHDERAHGLKTRDWKGPQLEAEKGRGLEVRTWRGHHVEKPRELVPENGDQRGPQWGDERQRGPEVGEEREVRLGVKRRRDLEDVVLVHLGDTRVTGLENGEGARSVGPKGRGEQGMGCGGAGGRCLGLGNGVPCGPAVGTVCEGDPEWAGTRRVCLAAGESPQEGGQEEGPREPKRPCCPSAEEEVDWEPLAKFRAACGPELAELVAEELAFARQHGTRGFHWTGAGFALKDGTSDFFLDRALTRCSCSIHAARRLPCRHLFAARLLTGAALFHMDLLRDCWGRAPEP
ncbi:uncharacterized protein ZSWIM9 isoform X1 [Acinonyx jubatus]|uniref:Uncharacterized protein ZSWIM9 isoform X1 n=1 Tax=Acinonyx jubatus TaxID=32536 RepID=A0A6J1XMJ9_ACIJB|nr:uncharacterized protein ZSWIM9 isoform X1 [Acinonyx jubatus]